MIGAWREGQRRRADAAQEPRRRRAGSRRRRRARSTARSGSIGTIDIPENVGDFRLLSRRARRGAAPAFPSAARFMKGLFAWIGFPCREIEYDRDAPLRRTTTKWNYWRLWNFALEGITSFSVVPLKLASYVGLRHRARRVRATASSVIVKTLLYGDPVAGYPTLVVLVLFLGGLQLMALGIIGEYLARMFIEVKQRPLYLVQRHLRAGRADRGARRPVPARAPPNGACADRARAPCRSRCSSSS